MRWPVMPEQRVNVLFYFVEAVDALFSLLLHQSSMSISMGLWSPFESRSFPRGAVKVCWLAHCTIHRRSTGFKGALADVPVRHCGE